MTITRRELIRRAGQIGVVTLVTGCGDKAGDSESASDVGTESESDSETGGDGLPNYEYDGEPGPEDLFQHGVASGDPLPDSVILWTRVTGASGEVEVFYEIAVDPAFEQRVAAAYVTTNDERDYTVKIDPSELDAGTTYYYRFQSLGRMSPVGRTRTAPSGAVARLRFAVVSCSSLAHGYFHAYGHVANRKDLDFVVHLGDYIYEYGDGEYGSLRNYEPPHEIKSLEDYRLRYAQYRREAPLQEVHRQHPMIAVWDDHEITNNAYANGAENHSDDEGDWETRKAIAYQVYHEWMPIREQPNGFIYRKLSYGDLLDLIMLDTRIAGRDPGVSAGDTDGLADPNRHLLGADQEAWLSEQLSASTAKWKVIGQQVMMGYWRGAGGAVINPDQWDGYQAAQGRFFHGLRKSAIDNVVVLTGDIHSFWATDLTDDIDSYDPETGDGSLAVEFVTSSVSSPTLQGGQGFLDLVLANSPAIRWGDMGNHGYIVVDLDENRVQGDYFGVMGITQPTAGPEMFLQGFVSSDGANRLTAANNPAPPQPEAPAPAP